MKTKFLLTAVMLVGLQTLSLSAHAEIVGASVIGVSISKVAEIASGWSIKKSIMNKPVYNELGVKIGSVDDLIIAPNKTLSYAIIGAGGFLGMGKYDVAIPVTQINEVNGKLQLKGATKESIKQMPKFEYATHNVKKDAFVANAEKDIQQGKDKLDELVKRASTENNEMKATINSEIIALQQQIKSAEDKLDELKHASDKKWHQFVVGVNAAIASIRKHFG